MECSISPLRAAIYLRTASAQMEDAMSVGVQRSRCLAYAQECRYAVIATLEDVGCSGAHLDRPGLRELRAMLRGGSLDVVIATSLDRLARSAADLAQLMAELEQAGVAIEAVNEADLGGPHMNTHMRHLETVVAQFERERLVQRMARGRCSVRETQPATVSAMTIRRVFELYTLGEGLGPLTAPQIAEQLHGEAVAQPIRVALYSRAAVYSSVTSQLRMLRAAAEAAGWSVARTITDRSAGGNLDRQELTALRDAARAGAIDLVLVVSLDRLARRVRDVATLREELAAAGCVIVSM